MWHWYFRPRIFLPLFAGGSDWLGFRLWPLWIEWNRGNGLRKPVKEVE